MIVKAAHGVKVPLENQPYAYIGQEPVEVENSAETFSSCALLILCVMITTRALSPSFPS